MVLKVKLRGQKGNKMKRERTSSLFGLVFDSEGVKIEFRERESTFSLRSITFGSSVLVGARGEVGLHCKGYAWVPVLWSFENSERLGFSPT